MNSTRRCTTTRRMSPSISPNRNWSPSKSRLRRCGKKSLRRSVGRNECRDGVGLTSPAWGFGMDHRWNLVETRETLPMAAKCRHLYHALGDTVVDELIDGYLLWNRFIAAVWGQTDVAGSNERGTGLRDELVVDQIRVVDAPVDSTRLRRVD